MGLMDRIRAEAQQRAEENRTPVAALLSRVPTMEDTHGFVRRTPELARICDLDRYDWRARPDLDDLVTLITDAYRLPGGAMTLRPVQAVALEQLALHGGLFASIAVGEGKTLISYLAPTALEAKTTVLLVPAKLRAKTHRDFAQLTQHWISPPCVHVLSYEWLGRAQAASALEDLAPDLILADECHRLKNLRAAVTRRVVRYLRDTGARAAFLSGTVTSRSLRDFHHLLVFSLGVDRMPLPASQSETHIWARAVDEKVEVRARPGALVELLEPGEGRDLESIRGAVGKRIYETPGVVHTSTSAVRASIVLDFFDPQ